MPCVTLSSGKTVCFDNPNSYKDGGKTDDAAFKKFVSTCYSFI
jgi:hypothetical protein